MIKTRLTVIGIAAVLTLAATITAVTTNGPTSIQQAFAIGDTGGVHSAKTFAPGQLAINSGLPANSFAPGQEAQTGKCSSPPSFPPDPCAPGIEKRIQTGPGP